MKENAVWASLTKSEKRHILLWYYTQMLDKKNHRIDRRTGIGRLLAKLRQVYKKLGIDSEIVEMLDTYKPQSWEKGGVKYWRH